MHTMYFQLAKLFQILILFSDCCKSIEVYHNDSTGGYTFKSIYGFYSLDHNKINNKMSYTNDGRSIWWYGEPYYSWRIGETSQKGLPHPIARLEESGSGYCLLNKTNTEFIYQNWSITHDGHKLVPALNQLKIRCRDPPPKESKYSKAM